MRRSTWTQRLVVTLLILSGAVVTAWPVAATYENNSRRAAVTTAYVERIGAASPEALSAELQAAHAYNQALAPSLLTDPWGSSTLDADDAHIRYLQTLASDPVMGRLRIPAIAVDLPVLHDAGRSSLSAGVGHMYGSALPVGGLGTHAVLAAHTGMEAHTFFDRLPELRVGQEFLISVAGVTLTYQVEQVLVVEPTDLETVRPVAGLDLLTLVTCYTPPGGHRQRMLVRGARVPGDNATPSATSTIDVVHSVEFVPVQADTSIQTWMWPRIAGAAAALILYLVIVATWIAADRRGPRQSRYVTYETRNEDS